VIFGKRHDSGSAVPHSKENLTDSLPNEERMFWEASRNLLDHDFPNPGRCGCPEPDVLQRIATGKMNLSEVKPWLAHLGSCSSCFKDVQEFQQRNQRPKRILPIIAALLAAILLLGLGLVAVIGVLREPSRQPQASILDLRIYPAIRSGEDENLRLRQPLLIQRHRQKIKVYLPLGSSEGTYEIQILSPTTHEMLITAFAEAHIIEHQTILPAELNLDSLHSGNYLLAVRREYADWAYYSLFVQ
jgi:hypothetical protein